jgi:hypothetical protein
MTATATQRKPTRHTFVFKLGEGEDQKTITAKAQLRRGRKVVELVLTAADVRRSIKLQGVGNTQTCSMAVCAKRHADRFPHAVEGYIDWTYSRAYVVSKVSAETKLPTVCVVYAHNDDIAKLNDSKDGQKALLADLEANGDRVIRLFPIKARTGQPKGRPEGKRNGTRTRVISSKGAAARFAFARLGGVPA